MTDANKSTLKLYQEKIDKAIDKYFCDKTDYNDDILSAMKYSTMNGGKRIRPVLVLSFLRMLGKDTEKYIDLSITIEMIHCFSLIHDDLPCMDDDDFRRGKPSCHKKFGEATALLAGDALTLYPFEILSKHYESGDISADTAIKLVSVLSNHAGIYGMIGGQSYDLFAENKTITLDNINTLQSLKTCKLIECACIMGAILADANVKTVKLAEEYAHNLGLAFQINDDILDVTGNFEELGKPIGSDKENEKNTYVSLVGLEKAKEYAKKYTDKALEILDNFDNNEFLVYLTKELLYRKK